MNDTYNNRRENGVWDLSEDGKTPVNVKTNYFMTKADGSPVDYNQDFYLPFIKRYIQAIKQVKQSYSVFFEPIPGSDPPVWLEKEQIKQGLVYAPHWYDLKAIFSKSFDGIVTHDVQGLSRVCFSILRNTQLAGHKECSHRELFWYPGRKIQL